MDLEERIDPSTKKGKLDFLGDWKNYWVDVASGWSYYTPVYAVQEAIAGKELDSIAATRAIGLAMHAVATRPIGKVRNYFANKWNITKESSFSKKLGLNLVAVTPIQAVAYAGMLLGGMVISGKYDWDSSVKAWIVGTGLGALHAFPYGSFQDGFRRLCGVQPAIKDLQIT